LVGRLRQDDCFNPVPIRVWRDHLSGRRNHQYPLWNVPMFQAWRAAQPRSEFRFGGVNDL